MIKDKRTTDDKERQLKEHQVNDENTTMTTNEGCPLPRTTSP